MFCFMHATLSRYHHYADLLTCIEHIQWNIPEAWVNACWVYSVESVSKMWLILSVTFLIFSTTVHALISSGPYTLSLYSIHY